MSTEYEVTYECTNGYFIEHGQIMEVVASFLSTTTLEADSPEEAVAKAKDDSEEAGDGFVKIVSCKVKVEEPMTAEDMKDIPF